MKRLHESRAGLWAGALALAAAAAGFAFDTRGMLRSYLFAWLFALGITLGALANLMVHTLTHGRWGEPFRPPLIAAVRVMWLVSLLALPVLAGVRAIYPWASEGPDKRPEMWLNVPFFEVRSVAYLVVWNVLAWLWLRADRSTADPSTGSSSAAVRVSAAGLIVYALTVTLAAYDWIASLTPDWFSSGFGLVVGVGQMLAGAAFGVAAAAWAAGGAVGEAVEQRFHDLGNLLLMYVLTWTYVAFAQFLIIWSEDLPHEIGWYLPRLQTDWRLLAAFLVTFHFFVPLVLLLSRAAKRSPATLGAIAGALLAVHAADVFWLVVPGLRPKGFALYWTDLAALAGVLAACALAWPRAWRDAQARAGALERRPAHG